MEKLEHRMYLQILNQRKLILVLVPLIAVIVAYIYTGLLGSTEYETKTKLFVGGKNNEKVSYTNIDDLNILMKNYTQLLTSNSVIEDVIQNLKLTDKYTSESLRNNIKVTVVDGTSFIMISVKADAPNTSFYIAEELVRVFQAKVIKLYSENSIKVIDEPSKPIEPIKKDIKINLSIAFVVGLACSIIYIFVVDYFDDTLKNYHNVEKISGIRLMGIIQE